jgi:hypothetical protein
MAYVPPTVAEFKVQFSRDFAYAVPASGTGGDATDVSKVTDGDITNAIGLAAFNINDGLFGSQAQFATAYGLLSAHYLVTSLQAAMQGLGGAVSWNSVHKSVGAIQETYQIPDRIAKSPTLSLLSKTPYGAQYLGIIAPLLIGNFVGVYGDTTID